MYEIDQKEYFISDRPVEIKQGYGENKERGGIIDKMFPTTMDKGWKQDPAQPLDLQGINSPTGEIAFGCYLKDLDEPKQAYKSYRKEQWPEKLSFIEFFLFQDQIVLSKNRHKVLKPPRFE